MKKKILLLPLLIFSSCSSINTSQISTSSESRVNYINKTYQNPLNFYKISVNNKFELEKLHYRHGQFLPGGEIEKSESDVATGNHF